MTEPLIRPLDANEIETLLGWATDEGWNPGLADGPTFYAADPAGFLGCFIDGTMAAGISAVRYGSDFGFIGLYIAHPDFRGQGFGRQVWDAGMAHLAGRTIGLDGVPQQQQNYRSMGFEPAYQTVRWSGQCEGFQHPDIVPVTSDLLPQVIAYDRIFFPAERNDFLTQWLRPPRTALAIVRDGTLRGLAVLRQCHDGCKVGPLFADTPADAENLMAACCEHAGNQPLHIDVPDAQETFSRFLAGQGFAKGFETSRMYSGPAPQIDTQGVFGITTLELG